MSVKGGSWIYPVYCFCVEKTVVQVPMGGVLKVIVMFPSTGDFMVVMFAGGGGNCPKLTVLCCRRLVSVKTNAFEEARNSRYVESVGPSPIGCRAKMYHLEYNGLTQRDLDKLLFPRFGRILVSGHLFFPDSMRGPCLTPAP